MVAVSLSILLVVLMSGAVLWVVAGEKDKPTSDDVTPADPEPAPPTEDVAPVEPSPAPAPPPRRPATSRRRPPPPPPPPPPPVTAPMAVQRPSPVMTMRLADAPLPRHRARSSVLLVLLVVLVGLLVAVLIGALLGALAFALRAAVTS